MLGIAAKLLHGRAAAARAHHVGRRCLLPRLNLNLAGVGTVCTSPSMAGNGRIEKCSTSFSYNKAETRYSVENSSWGQSPSVFGQGRIRFGPVPVSGLHSSAKVEAAAEAAALPESPDRRHRGGGVKRNQKHKRNQRFKGQSASGEGNSARGNDDNNRKQGNARQKRRKQKKKQPKPPKQTFQHRTHGPNGRPIMTKQRLEDPTITSLKLDPQHAKNIVHSAQQKLMFRQHMSHDAEGPAHDRFFVATTTTTVPDRSVLRNIPACATISDDGSVELVSTGAARNKKRAEFLAAVDLIVQLRDCGIDARNPPDLRALRKAEEKERFQAEVQEARTLLEVLNVSRPQFEVKGVGGNQFVANVFMFVHGTPLTAVGIPGHGKKEAEGRAIIAAVGKPLEDLLGVERIEECKSLIRASPAGHVTSVRVPRLPDEVFDVLSECMGSPDDHAERMKLHAETKLGFESKFRESGSRHETPRTRSGKKHSLAGNRSAINKAFMEEESSRCKEALDNPSGRKGAMQSVRNELPIKAIRQDFVEALRSHPVLVVSGGTGSGKSTQCPQYILEDAIANEKGADTRIVVTQPRRIAAISVAERVADERGERIGNSVGYTVRFNREAPREAGSIEFVTTGVLLRRLVNDPTLQDVSHVMIDEVHERDIDTDFLLVLLRELLAKRPELRVILMSATLNADAFGEYFARDSTGHVPVMSVPTTPRHPVEVIYLEDIAGESKDVSDEMSIGFPLELQGLGKSLLQLHDQQMQLELEEADAEEAAAVQLEARSYAEDEGEVLDDSDSDSDSDEEDGNIETKDTFNSERSTPARLQNLRRAVSMRNAGSSSIYPMSMSKRLADKREIGEITVELVAKVAQHVSQMETDAGRKGSILCFLPGWDEIKAAMAILEKADPCLRSKMNILPLHSTIPQDDQQKVFKPAADGEVKVILATTIAESSVTINDVLAVVDCGLVRELNFDAEKGMSTMETLTTSKASATQRLGRAGRVAPGKCYRIFSRGTLEAMFERPMPEIQRTALEATCLQTCSMTRNGVDNFLRRAMDPPPEDSVAVAMDRLVKLGAINVENGNEALSPLGLRLSRLPLDPATGRMLIMGCVIQCLDPVLTAAACFSSRDPFYKPLGMRDEAQRIRRSFCDTSDLMAAVRAYNEFQDIIRQHGWDDAKEWASENFVSISAMISINAVRGQLLNELHRIGLVANNDLVRTRSKTKMLREDAIVNQNAGCDMLHSAVWAVGLPGNLSARHLGSFGTLRTRTESHAGLHPSSVAFHRKPPRGGGAKLPQCFVYSEMVLSSQVFLRGCTALTPEQLVLFGGYALDTPKALSNGSVNDPLEESKSQEIMQEWVSSVDFGSEDSLLGQSKSRRVLDDWIVIDGKCNDTIDLLSDARDEINAALEFKIMHPRKPLPEASQSIIDGICDVFEMLDDRDADETVHREY